MILVIKLWHILVYRNYLYNQIESLDVMGYKVYTLIIYYGTKVMP